MQPNNLFKTFYMLLFSLFILTFCNGQSSKHLKNNKTQSKPILAGFTKLTKKQGSTENDNVWCGLQDKKCNLWFGTTGEGVYRFDGKIFTQFTVRDGLSNNCVYSILEDKSGKIWFGTIDGICRFDGKNIIPIPLPASVRPMVSNIFYSSQSTKKTVWCIFQDKKGKLCSVLMMAFIAIMELTSLVF